MILSYYQKILKNSITNILKLSLAVAMMATGSCGTVKSVTLQGHTISTSTGRKLTWDHQTLEKQIESSSISGKRAQLMQEVMECATLRIDDQGFPSWLVQRRLTELRFLETHGSVSYQSLVVMLKRCLQTKLYQYQQTTHSSLNQYKMEWNDQRPNYRIRSPHEDSPVNPLPSQPKRNKKDLIQQ